MGKKTGSLRKSIKFCSFGGYRLFCASWWWHLVWYLTGLNWNSAWSDMPLKLRWSWGNPGWYQDIWTYWHRARYGWAPSDTWGLDHYLNKVLAGSLEHLALNINGSPAGYGSEDENGETNHEKWEQDLLRWAKAFSEDPEAVAIYDTPDYTKHSAEVERRRTDLHNALKEMEPYWDALWD